MRQRIAAGRPARALRQAGGMGKVVHGSSDAGRSAGARQPWAAIVLNNAQSIWEYEMN